MTFQAKPSYLPSDLRDYSAPRPRRDIAWAALAACLAVVAWVEPNDAAVQVRLGDSLVPSGQAPHKAEVGRSVPALAAPLCQSLNRGQWLYAAIQHDGDLDKRTECLYGHSSQRWLQ